MVKLYDHPLFRIRTEELPVDDRIRLSYQRAKLAATSYGLTAADIHNGTKKYWDLHRDPCMAIDAGCWTVIGVHVTLTLGTLYRYLDQNPYLQKLVDSLLRFDAFGLYLLTERGHGLDVFHLETTATVTEDGFILNTPNEAATKFMPATTPLVGVAKVALVIARLIVDNTDLGCRTFIVPICNEKEMYKGVTSILLPPRSGACPLDFSFTRFNNVHLPRSALLGPLPSSSIEKMHVKKLWWTEIEMVQRGKLAICSAPVISALKIAGYIGGMYSLRRKIMGSGGTPVPIFSFRTQQWSVLQTIATARVMDAWLSEAIDRFQDTNTVIQIRHATSVIFKATCLRHLQLCNSQMMERLGAVGTFDFSIMNRIDADCRGAVIAEGDLLAICIRLFSELLLNRYEIPMPPETSSLLALHANAILSEMKEMAHKLVSSTSGRHHIDAFNALMLPQAETTILAIGHSLAYAAGKKANLPPTLLKIYECAVIRLDPAWYTERGGLSRSDQRIKEDEAITEALPFLNEYLASLNVAEYVTSPIISDKEWEVWLQSLPVFTGKAAPVWNDFIGKRDHDTRGLAKL